MGVSGIHLQNPLQATTVLTGQIQHITEVPEQPVQVAPTVHLQVVQATPTSEVYLPEAVRQVITVVPQHLQEVIHQAAPAAPEIQEAPEVREDHLPRLQAEGKFGIL